MKKLAVAIFVALLGLAFTAPAFALENQFGGYWRLRMISQENFDGVDGEPYVNIDGDPTGTDLQRADTRTRLYYTAVINDNLKFVNKFEMDAVWGSGTYGGIGADGVAVEVKNSYVDFNYAGANFKLGTQGATIQRGFVFADDFSGIVASMNGFTAVFAKVVETGTDGAGEDTQMYHVNYVFDLDGVKITPNFTYVDGDWDGLYDINSVAFTDRIATGDNDDSAWYLGLDVDATLGGASVWGTLIYNGGEMGDVDIEAWLVAAGFSMSMNDMVGIHGQAFYATGNDVNDDDVTGFQDATTGASYYWAEIMGLGTFDEQGPLATGEGDVISGIYAINFGASYKYSDKLTFTGDLWYAALTEDSILTEEDDLGVEIDLVADYELVEGMNLKLVAAYLFAGDATTYDQDDDENPMEIGAQFSISF